MADMRTASGKIGYLRVHDVGTGYGPLSDLIDGECMIKFIDQPDNAYGFQLRNDEHTQAHNGMFDLIRDAYFHDRHIHIEYFIEPGKNNGRIFRVYLD